MRFTHLSNLHLKKKGAFVLKQATCRAAQRKVAVTDPARNCGETIHRLRPAADKEPC